MGFEVFISSAFKRELKRIAKKHKRIINDIDQLISDLSKNPTIGKDLGQNIYKIRTAITGTSKGKSGGARVITYIKFSKESVILAEIYLKTEHDIIGADTIIDRLNHEGFL